MEPSKESQALSALLAKFMEHADTPGSIAEAVKDLILHLKTEALDHNTRCVLDLTEDGLCQCDGQKYRCVGSHVMRILKAACNKADPMYEGMDMIERMQVQQGATMAMHMVK